jgi:multimeric flavodoxin WrbA
MKIVILYDSSDSEGETVKTTLSQVCAFPGTSLELIDVAKETLKPCIGCFGCWIRTPGICVHTKDKGQEFLSKVLLADYTLFVSRITWGGYSLPVKAYADRLLPLLHPYFEKRNGEMHHKMRYGKMPSLLAVGFGAKSAGEEKTFGKYTDAHRDNLADRAATGTFIWNSGNSGDGYTNEARCAAWFSKEIGK